MEKGGDFTHGGQAGRAGAGSPAAPESRAAPLRVCWRSGDQAPGGRRTPAQPLP